MTRPRITHHGMLDLETMGNGPNAAITAIGLVLYDTETKEKKTFYSTVDLQSSISAGCEMDVSTVLWWMQQSDEAREIYKDNSERSTIWTALADLNKFVYNHCLYSGNDLLLKLWGNGSTFDNVILHNAYKRAEMYDPFRFWNDCCYRTLKGLYPEVKLERVGTHHNALDDAESQMDHLLEIFGFAGLK